VVGFCCATFFKKKSHFLGWLPGRNVSRHRKPVRRWPWWRDDKKIWATTVVWSERDTRNLELTRLGPWFHLVMKEKGEKLSSFSVFSSDYGACMDLYFSFSLTHKWFSILLPCLQYCYFNDCKLTH
jgi:hypothetical protein